MRSAAVVFVLAACGKGTPSASPEVKGTLSIGGTLVTVTRCHPDHGIDTYLILETASGALRFEDKALYWNAEDREGLLRGKPLACSRLDRSWGGGVRLDGSAYFRGTLSFDCTLDAEAVSGNLDVDCGNITAAERAQLDGHRKDLLEQQKTPATTP